MLASVTLALGLCVTACGPGLEPETDTSSTTADETGPSMTTMVSTTMVPTSTDDGPAMTTIAETSIDGDSTDDGVGSFYAVRPDGPSSTIECDLFAQDCPPGEKCMPWANDGGGSWNATRCTPVADDPGQEDEPCQVEGNGLSGIDDCDAGLMCFEVDPKTNEGTCFALCGGTSEDPTCPSEDQFCSITGDGLLTICLDSCDPLMPTCPADQACYPYHANDLFTCMPIASNGMQGDTCLFLNDCVAGQVCLAAELVPECMGVSCCTAYCDTNAPETCPDAMLGATCQPWYEPGMAPAGLENVGVCALPP